VYLGAPNIDEYEPLGRTSPHRGIIKAHDFDNFTHLAQHISFLDTHDDEYMKYHTWRSLLPDDAVWPPKWGQQPQWQKLRKMEATPAAGNNRENHYTSLRICEIVKQNRVSRLQACQLIQIHTFTDWFLSLLSLGTQPPGGQEGTPGEESDGARELVSSAPKVHFLLTGAFHSLHLDPNHKERVHAEAGHARLPRGVACVDHDHDWW
jgi:hypothetical protein